MKITVWSALSGKVSGHLVMNVPPTHTIRKLLDTYCSHKGVQSSRSYVIRSKDSLLLNPNKSLESLNIDDGDTLTLGLSDDEEQTFGFGSWWMVTLASLLIGIIGLAAAIWIYLKPVATPLKFGIVMDAGSSHSEIFIYSWNGEKPMGTADVTFVDACYMAGGVSSFADHVDDLGGYLEKCLNKTKHTIPKTLQAGTTFYVGATAGMRILRDFDPDAAQLILATIREVLMTKTPFTITHDNIDIIPGSEEGVSGWISLNYLLGDLQGITSDPTAATMDVGGASMQISSVLRDEGTWTSENLTLFRHNFSVISQSFMCYGIAQAQHRYEYLLINTNETVQDNGSFVDPCLARGVVHSVTEDDLNGPCTLTDDSVPVLSGLRQMKYHQIKKISQRFEAVETEHNDMMKARMMRKRADKADTIFTRGSSNAAMCDENMRKLFDLQTCEDTFTYGDCMSAEVVHPITGKVVGFSHLFEQARERLDLKPNMTQEEFKKAVFDVCSLSAEDLYAKFPNMSKAVAEDICFDGMYLFNLLTVGLGIEGSKWTKMRFTHWINNIQVEWPMGFMLNQTTVLMADLPPKTLTLTVFILLMLLFGAFVISGFMFLWHSIKIKKQSTSYQRLIADHLDYELHRFI